MNGGARARVMAAVSPISRKTGNQQRHPILIPALDAIEDAIRLLIRDNLTPRGSHEALAADCGIAPAQLSRQLNRAEGLHWRVVRQSKAYLPRSVWRAVQYLATEVTEAPGQIQAKVATTVSVGGKTFLPGGEA